MEDLLRQLIGYLKGMWLYRWWGVLAAWIVGLLAAGAIYVMPDRYESSARIYVDTQSVLKPLMSGLAVQPDVGQQISILSRTLISRPNVEKLIRMADLDLSVKNSKDREQLIAELTQKLKIRAVGRDDLYIISYEDGEPQRAKRVVQSLVSIFVESGLGDKRKDTDAARRFIEDQISSYEQRLEEAENRLKDFKIKNLGFINRDYVSQMSEASAQLEQARLELREAENSRDALRSQLNSMSEDTSAMQSFMPQAAATPEIDARIAALESNLDAMLQRYTENHPDVVGARRVIEQLQKQKEAEIAAQAELPNAGAGEFSTNPAMQQMQVTLASAEARVASLRARVGEYQSRYEKLRESSELRPKIEAELAQLDRDYAVNKRNYETLVARRESANMSVEMESSSGMAEFRLIDPPTLPSKPSAPNRVLLMPLAGLLALCAGLAVAFVLSQLRPTFLDGRDLREVTGLPLLGVVGETADPTRKRRRKRMNAVFLGSVGAYIGTFALLTAALIVLGKH